MITRLPFGSTGHQSSRVIFGACAFANVTQDTADAVLPLLLRYGVNHIDTAIAYGDSELRLRPFLAEHRDEFFLATKTEQREGDAARASLERSLERLGVEQIDLIQLHNLVEQDEFEQAFGPNGAVEALARARDEGLVRFIGVTGHGLRIPAMHLKSLDRFPFDAVLFPYNYTLMRIDSFRRDLEELLGVCSDRGVATQAMKSIARGRWPTQGAPAAPLTWYEPLQDREAITRAVGYALGREQVFLISSSDYRYLDTILDAAEENTPVPSDDELEADISNFKVTALFDGGALETN
jgi:aryl-alcohol dehydrogenase-like predicted oxidoreductase